ncbi:hypothetical protein CDAR_252181 [Caerostris darwini]|uniref:Uncharacterized protein n=1 Tax=Caerostris darwini TaxID=1538125 RepID=A0AAV4Q9M9_9ARAC|nr:hypothetical protein CDAR_252181 [Caerostris darwini]
MLSESFRPPPDASSAHSNRNPHLINKKKTKKERTEHFPGIQNGFLQRGGPTRNRRPFSRNSRCDVGCGSTPFRTHPSPFRGKSRPRQAVPGIAAVGRLLTRLDGSGKAGYFSLKNHEIGRIWTFFSLSLHCQTSSRQTDSV